MYTLTAFSPNSALKFDWPKKYQPMIVENAKKNMHTAMKIGRRAAEGLAEGGLGQRRAGHALRDQAVP